MRILNNSIILAYLRENPAAASSLVKGLIILGAVVFIVAIVLIRRAIIKAIIKKKSRRYLWLEEVNKKAHFLDIPQELWIPVHLYSKRQFDYADANTLVMASLMDPDVDYPEIFKACNQNRYYQNWYTAELEKMPSPLTDDECRSIHLSSKTALKYEEKLLSAITHEKPATEPPFIFSCTYTSPQGLRSYSVDRKFPFDIVKKIYDQAANAPEEQINAAHERALMTPDLRYRVLKRDGFKCVLCGRSAADGVKLHVDHIVPVSKGGKTELSNLRTLCADCNLGKGAKYDPSGVN